MMKRANRPVLKESLKNFLFGFRFYVLVNSYRHVEMVSSPKYTFFLDKLD